MILSFSLLVIIVYIAIAIVRMLRRPKHSRTELPGPPRLPIIGNLHQVPAQYPWLHYEHLSNIHGPIYKLQYGLHTIIMLGDHTTARDLLDKRSSIYSSRPEMPMGDRFTRKLYMILMKYGPRFRAHQRIQASYLNNRVSQTYAILQDLESKQTIYDMLNSNDFPKHFKRFSASLILALSYGKRLPRGDEYEATALVRMVEEFSYALRPGTWIVDALPMLNILPRYLAPWKRTADKMFDFASGLHLHDFATAEKSSSWNWSKQARSTNGGQEMETIELAYHVGNVYGAASETTVNALEFFILAAVLSPEFVAKAQAEIDEVTGCSRMPTMADKDSLPYIHAFIQEILRWRPVLATGLPHAVTEDDTYLGYHIPKGSTIIANHWALSHDENIYKNPHEFNPDCWIENPDLPLAAFGFGRRVCPGRHVGRNSLFIMIARLLWAFNITYDGEKPDPMALTQGFSCAPVPFKAIFKIRSAERERIVRSEWDTSEKNTDVLLEQIHKLHAVKN